MKIFIMALTNVKNAYVDVFEVEKPDGTVVCLDCDTTEYQRRDNEKRLGIVMKAVSVLVDEKEEYLNGHGEEISFSKIKYCQLYTEEELPEKPYFQIETVAIEDGEHCFVMKEAMFDSISVEDQCGKAIENKKNDTEICWEPSLDEEMFCMFKLSEESPLYPKLIGVVRGDFGHDGKEFYHTWTGYNEKHNDEEFKEVLTEVIDYFRTEANPSVLKDFSSMKQYCMGAKPNFSNSPSHSDNRGIRVTKSMYTFFIRLVPHEHDYHFYVVCFYDYCPDRFEVNIELQSVISDEKWTERISGFSSLENAKMALSTYVKHLIHKNNLKEKYFMITVGYSMYNLVTKKDEYADRDDGYALFFGDELKFYDETEEYPCTFRVDLDESICGRKEAFLILHSQEDMNDVVSEFDGLLSSVREFETVEGDAIDSNWIIRPDAVPY